MLQTLGISRNFIAADGAAALARCLAQLSSLQTLDISDCNFGIEGGASISSVLGYLTLLHTLNIRNNKFSSEGWRAVMDALEPSTSLTSLNEFDVARICGGGAVEVNLGYKEEGLAVVLCRWLPRSAATLTSLDLRYNNINCEEGTGISSTLGQLTSLIKLDLANNKLSAEGWRVVMDVLKPISSLTSLNGFIVAGLFGSGAEVNLSNADAELADALYCLLPRSAATLSSLNLRYNNVGGDGGTVISSVLSLLTSLQLLDLRDNNLDAEGWRAVMDALEPSTSLTSLNGFDVARICGGGAVEVNLSNKEEGLAVVLCRWLPRSAATLTSLDLSSNRLGSEGVTALSSVLGKLTSLQTLNIRNNNIDAEGWRAVMDALEPSTSLTSLNGFDVARICGGGAVEENLGYREAGLAVVLCRWLPRSAATLTSLDLRETKLGSYGGAVISSVLFRLTSLQTLYLSSNNLGAVGGTAISSALGHLTSLQTLDLRGNKMGMEGWRVIMDALEVGSSLTSFNDLGVVGLRTGGLTELCASNKEDLVGMLGCWLPRSASSLTTLDLRYNQLGESGTAISSVLGHLTSLLTLDLSHNNLGDECGTAISSSLGLLTLLQTLNLSGNNLGKDVGIAIASVLGQLMSLQTLNLGYNKMEGEGGTAISSVLGLLTSLQTLDLCHNNLGAQGAQALSLSLASMTGLQTLLISNNDVGGEGVAHLAAALPSMSCLVELSVLAWNSSVAEKTLLKQAALPSLAKIS